MAEYDNQIPRKLEERSYLRFEFPGPDGDDNDVIYLPFYENRIIKESKRANYATYKILSRSSELFAYTGAQARSIDLSFNLTIDHLVSYHLVYEKFAKKAGTKSTEEEKNKFFVDPTTSEDKIFPYGARRKMDEYASLLEEEMPGVFTGTRFGTDHEVTRRDKTQDIVMFWINIIRSSLTNNSDDPRYGPPIVRLNHGMLYNQIPCIAMDYNISPLESGGYNLRTLMPRVLKINLKLKEIRAGTFDQYSTSSKTTSDNLAGYESVLGENHTMDPFSSEIDPQGNSTVSPDSLKEV